MPTGHIKEQTFLVVLAELKSGQPAMIKTAVADVQY
jgi:hypothetical protein